MAEATMCRSLEETLQLALDVCLGVGAFWATPIGAVDVSVSDATPPDDGVRRIEHLANSCLSHPAASGREFFWNAEVSTEADSADRSLACVVVPSWRGDVLAGLLGVVDVWLPEPDEAQRAALASLASDLAWGRETGERQPLRLTPAARLGVFAPGPAPGAPVAAPDGAEPARSRAPAVAAPASSPLGETALDRLALDVLRHLPDALVVTQRDGTILLSNDRFARMVGRLPEELPGADVRAMVVDTPGEQSARSTGPVGQGHPRARRLVVVSRSGEQLPVTAVDVRIGGAIGTGVGNGHLAAPAAVGDRFVTILRPAPSSVGCAATGAVDCVDLVGNLDDGVLLLDDTGTVVLANRAADRLHGLPPDRSLVGALLPEVSGLRSEDGQPLTTDMHPGTLAIRDGEPCTAQLALGGEGDRQQHVTATARPFPVDGRLGALVVLHDSTSEWLEQQRLTQYALYDPLTGLANRYLLLEELRRMLLLLARQGGAVALVYLDLDGFKQINDEYGHDMGDEVLAAVARRLRGAVRSDDVVARLGGDEFVIAHASTERLPDGDLVVSRLRKVLSAPFRVRSQAFDVGASIGWVSTDRGEEGPEPLLAKADRAMYLQKRTRAAARRASA